MTPRTTAPAATQTILFIENPPWELTVPAVDRTLKITQTTGGINRSPLGTPVFLILYRMVRGGSPGESGRPPPFSNVQPPPAVAFSFRPGYHPKDEKRPVDRLRGH